MFCCSSCKEKYHIHYKVKNKCLCVWCNIEYIINKL